MDDFEKENFAIAQNLQGTEMGDAHKIVEAV